MASEEVTCFPVMFDRIRKLITKRQNELLRPYGLSSLHSMYLAALFHVEEGLSLRELCERLWVDKANTSRAIADLERQEYVKRVYQSGTKVRFRICLTNTGRDVATAVAESMKEAHDILLGALTDQEIETAHRVIRKLVKISEQI